MPNWLSSGIVALAIFSLGQIGVMIWWMSRVNTLLTIIRNDIDRIDRDLEHRDKKIEAALKKIDEIKTEVLTLKIKTESRESH